MDWLPTRNPRKIKKLVGKTLKEKAFLSTSLVEDGILNYHLILAIKVPKGATAGYIAQWSCSPEQCELLFDAGQELLITEAITNHDDIFLKTRLLV